MTVINGRSNLKTDPVRNFRFLAEFKPHKAAGNMKNLNTKVGFTSVSGLSITTESIPYREGGYNTSVHQIPGQTTFSPITFQRGVVLGTDRHWQWMRELYKVINGSGTTGAGAGALSDFRCDIIIKVLAHPTAGSATGTGGAYNVETLAAGDDIVALKFKVYNAWVTSLAYSDLNAGDNALMVEQMTVVHEGFDMLWAADENGTTADFAY